MSLDGKYILEIVGPYGETEIPNLIADIERTFPCFFAREVATGTVIFETKSTHCAAVAEYAKKINAISALASNDQNRPWRIIYEPERFSY